MWLTRLALRNPILILMVSLMVMAMGALCLDRLSVDLFPQINIPVIRVVTFYGGAGPGDIEKSITQPIERTVAAAPGVDRVESTSKQGASIVSVWFNFDVNLDTAQFEVSQRVAQVQSQLPPGIAQPFILKFDVTNIPVASVSVSAEGMDEKQLYDLAYNTIEPQFERLPGVASATPGGGKQREILVKVDREKLRGRQLGILDVVDKVKTSNLIMPSGNLKAGDRDYNVFTNTQIEGARPLEEVIVKPGSVTQTAVGGTWTSTPPVKIGDIAEVLDGTAEQSNIVRINGQRGVYVRIFKQPGANTISVVDEVKKAIPDLRGLPPNVKLEISFDQSTYIRSAVRSLEHEAIYGGVLAVAVILVFLASVRGTAIVALAIPMSIIASFILLYFTGQTLNIFTLGGLALGVGRLVDDSIVELENIHRHIAINPDRKQGVLDAAKEVAMPIFVSTLTTVIVFLPVLFLAGIAKNLFLPLALTITFALVMSFFVSRTVTPLLCMYWLKGGHKKTFIERGLDKIDDVYARILGWTLRHRFIVIGGILAIFVGSLFLVKKIGTEFFPATDEAQISMTFKTPIGTRVEKTEEVAKRLESTIAGALPNAKDGSPMTRMVLSDVGLPLGRTAVFTGNTGPHAGGVNVNLVPRSLRDMGDVEATEKIRAALKQDYPGTSVYFFTGGIVKRILNFGSAAPVAVEVLGYDLESLAQYSKSLMPKLRAATDTDGKPVLIDVQVSREENYPQIDVQVDRTKAGSLGITEQQVAQSVLATLVGSTQFSPIPFIDRKTGNEYRINIRMDEEYRANVGDLGDIFLRSPAGTLVPLSNIARVDRSSGPVLITRKYLQRVIEVTANVAPDKDLGKASAIVDRVLFENPPPDGVTAKISGQTLAQREAFSGLGLAILLALALVYMVLAAQFKSLLDPLVIMFSVPLGVTGVFAMLYVTKTTLSVNSAMGIIMMVGIVVSNGVLLVDFANVLRARGKPLMEATVEAARTRLRPILMTTIATIVGLIPMAMGIGEGSEANMPLARAVIGGLTVSTFFTLFLIPSLYTLIERFSKRTHVEEEATA